MSCRVLIVEDDADFATSLELALGLVDCEVVLASSAEDAYRIMETDDIQFGFFDVKLPGDDGITCFETIRKKKAGFAGILMTGFRDRETLQRARNAGIDEILLKPFRMADFMTLAKRYSTTGLS